MSSSPRSSYNDDTKRDIPSFIEARPPVILNPFMRPRPPKGTNLMERLEESEYEEPELVQVYLRLKPCNNPSNLYEVRSERTLISSLDTTTAGHGRRTQHNVSKMYTFSHIFGPDSNQKEIFDHIVKDNLKMLPEGQSFTLLTYGASGSGKTFTLMGTVKCPGLVPRSLEYVFKVVDAAQEPLYKPDERGADKLSCAEQGYELKWVKRLREISAPIRDKYKRMSLQLSGDLTVSTIDLSNRKKHYVWVSFIEIYNEGIYDLLAAGDRRNAPKLAIREDTSGNVYVKGATQAFVRSGEEAYDVMVAGKHNLQVAATGIHAQSSRSHCIFTITMLTETEGGVRSACVQLCDLAGCERAARTRNAGARMRESRAINSSLHVLERCLRALRRRRAAPGAPAVVPYRESKLTRLLGAGLSGARGQAVAMLVTLNPRAEYANETRHVLQLAAVAKEIQINDTFSDYPSTVESCGPDTTLGYGSGSVELMKLRADNERLLFELNQAQARNAELVASMREKDAARENTLFEVQKTATAICAEYYEKEMNALKTKIDEMAEELYERRMSQTSHDESSPSKDHQNQIAQLMTEIAILQETLSAERLARARAEEEVQHLRTCIDERDEKCEDNTEDVISLTDSEHSDSEDDPCNESLEPTFNIENINRSRMIRKSMIADIITMNTIPDENDPTSDESVSEKVISKYQDKSNETNVNDTYLTGEELNFSDKLNESDGSYIDNNEVISTVKKASDQIRDERDINTDSKKTQMPLSRETYFTASSTVTNISKDDNLQEKYVTMQSQEKDIAKTQRPLSRETYFVDTSTNIFKDNNLPEKSSTIQKHEKESYKTQQPFSRETSDVTNTAEGESLQEKSGTVQNKDKEISKSQRPLSRETYFVETSEVTETSNDNKPIEKSFTIQNQQDEMAKTTRPLSRETYFVETCKITNASEDKKNQKKSGTVQNQDTEIPKTELDINRKTYFLDTSEVTKTSKHSKLPEKSFTIQNQQNKMVKTLCPLSRETYFVATSELNISEDNELQKLDDVKDKDFHNSKNYQQEDDKMSKLLKKDVTTPDITLKVETKNNIHIAPKILPCTYVKTIMSALKQSTESNDSLAQFERLEMETNGNDNDNKKLTEEFYNIKYNKENRKYFDEHCFKNPTILRNKDKKISFHNNDREEIPIELANDENKSNFENVDKISQEQINNNNTKEIDEYRSPSTVKQEVPNDFKPITIKKLLPESMTKNTDKSASITRKNNISSKGHESIDIFDEIDSPRINVDKMVKTQAKIIENFPNSIGKSAIIDKVSNVFDSTDIIEVKSKNTYDEETYNKEVIVTDVVHCPIETLSTGDSEIAELELKPHSNEKNLNVNPHETLTTDDSQLQANITKANNTTVEFENIYKDVTVPRAMDFDLLVSQSAQESGEDTENLAENSDTGDFKYNLRRKPKFEKPKVDWKRGKNKATDGDILLESLSKCESKSKPRKNLRLRRQKNALESDVEENKLKDIVNLQSEFSDVTLDVPAPVKTTADDIPSPEKNENDENSPILGIQSCPAKSIQRSRRKLFTPRAEPLEESSVGTGDSTERVRVLRPSYHRPRARRRL